MLPFLAGCASLSGGVSDPGAIWNARQAALGQIRSWSLKGRFVTEGALSSRGSVRWTQTDEAFELLLTGPFGFGSAQVQGTPTAVEIRTGGERQIAVDPQAAIAERFGLLLPVAALRYWMLGIPAPGSAAVETLDEHGRLRILEQSGWRVQFGDYAAVAEHDLPHLLEASYGEQGVRFVIRAWRSLE